VLAASALGTGGVSYLGGMYGTAGIKLTPAEQQYLEGLRKGHAIAEDSVNVELSLKLLNHNSPNGKGEKDPDVLKAFRFDPKRGHWWSVPRTPPISRRPLVTSDRHRLSHRSCMRSNASAWSFSWRLPSLHERSAPARASSPRAPWMAASSGISRRP